MSLIQSLLTSLSRKKVPGTSGATGQKPQYGAGPPQANSPVNATPAGEPEGPTTFDQFAELASLEQPTEVTLTQAQLEQEDQLKKSVFSHFRSNRPPPSTLPAVSMRVLNLIASPKLSLAELTRLVAQDPALSAGILKVANSAAYAGVQEIDTLRDAVTRLGLVEVGNVAGMVATRSLYQAQAKSEQTVLSEKWNSLFVEAVTAARVAAWLAMQTKGTHGDHAFLAGMLHDLGRPIALRSVAALSLVGDAVTIDPLLVDRVIERVHVEIGIEIHTEWQLPRFSTIVAVRHHELGLPTDGEFRDLHVVRLSSAITQLRGQPWRRDHMRDEINESCAVLGIDAFKLRTIDTQARTEMSRVVASFTNKS